jgi:hypothetical protein
MRRENERMYMLLQACYQLWDDAKHLTLQRTDLAAEKVAALQFLESLRPRRRSWLTCWVAL